MVVQGDEPRAVSSLTGLKSLNLRGFPGAQAGCRTTGEGATLGVKSAASVAASIIPHLSTANRMDPLYMSILALRSTTASPSFMKSTCD
jgi:hypothetical protein